MRKFDMFKKYREAGMTVWAHHCPNCGRWAHVEAGNNGVDWLVWRRTNCANCGVFEVEETYNEETLRWEQKIVDPSG